MFFKINEIVFKTTNTSIGFPCSGTSTVKDIDGNIIELPVKSETPKPFQRNSIFH